MVEAITRLPTSIAMAFRLRELLRLIIKPSFAAVEVCSDFADCLTFLDHVARSRLSFMIVATFIADAIVVAAVVSSSTAELVAFGQRRATTGPRGSAGRLLC